MMRGLGAAASLMGATVISAVAAISAGASTDTYTFQNCQGGSTPPTFTAVKTSLPDTSAHGVSASIAYRLTDGSGVFVVFKFGDFYIGNGLANNPRVTTSCDVHFSSPDETLTLSGFLVAAGG